jgi:hypothetical protein
MSDHTPSQAEGDRDGTRAQDEGDGDATDRTDTAARETT